MLLDAERCLLIDDELWLNADGLFDVGEFGEHDFCDSSEGESGELGGKGDGHVESVCGS